MTPSRTTTWSVGLLAAAVMLLEGTLLRLLAIAQHYHFAFLVISLALLGIGASGAYLSLQKISVNDVQTHRLRQSCLLFSLSVGVAYAAINLIPFDSYTIAWDPRQILFFGMYYLALGLSFFFGGLGIGVALISGGEQRNVVYAANLAGSGLGALLTPVATGSGGVPGAILFSCLVGLFAAYPIVNAGWRIVIRWLAAAGFVLFTFLGMLNIQGSAPLGMILSPYKGLLNALRFPGSSVEVSRWNAISRIDLVTNAGIHQLTGLSYTYTGPLPAQQALFLDGDGAQAINLATPDTFEAGDFLPEAISFRLLPDARVLVVEPGGGTGVLQAIAGKARRITVVENNPLVSRIVNEFSPSTSPFLDARVHTISMPVRPFLYSSEKSFDIVFFPLIDRYLPIRSGAFSLAETYNLTVESFHNALSKLDQDGILVISRWLQTPQSENLRLITTLAAAIEMQGDAPGDSLVIFRGLQTVTALARPGGWTVSDLASVRAYLESRRFDLVWAPDIQLAETNRFNRFAGSEHFLSVEALLDEERRDDFIAGYPFAIQPVLDDRPFFFHFFRPAQTQEVLATLGMTWQPFGGSGFLLLFALLLMVLLFSTVLILLPVFVGLRQRSAVQAVGVNGRFRLLLYFTALGIAFLFVEIPLIQRWILYLGHASYSFIIVVPGILLSSGLGSLVARNPKLPKRALFALLVGLVFAAAFWFPRWMQPAMGWPLWAQILLTVLLLAPLGFLMGLPFPWGLIWLEEHAPGLIAWAWAINGCASVIAAVLAAILAMSYGFMVVIALGGLAYTFALLVYFLK